MKKGKILLITTDFPPSIGGGICTHSKFMVESLRKLDWDFVVLSEYYINSTQEQIDEYVKLNNFPIYKLPESPSFYKLIQKLIFCIRICLKHKPDIILGTGRHPVWFAAFTSFICRKPLITIGHGTEFTEKTSKNDFLINRLAYSYSKVIIAISNFTKSIIENQKITPKKIEVVYNAADENFFKKIDNSIIEKFKKKNNLFNKKIILTVGALSERKGQKVIIQALPKIKEQFPEVLYVAIGIPKKREEFEELATSINVKENVFFPGIVTDEELLLWINTCDVFSMTSVVTEGDYEGYGIAVVEAALCGKTSVVSDSAGLKEAVINDLTGIIVPENSPNETADAFIKLFSNNSLLQKLSEDAYKYAKQNNTWRKKGEEYSLILETLKKTVIF